MPELLLAALLDTLADIVTIFAWLFFITAVLFFGTMFVVEPLIDWNRTRKNNKLWKQISQARREWELDELKCATSRSQTERWEYVWPSAQMERRGA